VVELGFLGWVGGTNGGRRPLAQICAISLGWLWAVLLLSPEVGRAVLLV